MPVELLLYFVVLVEGYSVLALELIAIRQLVPFVGSGVETVAILVAAVLMPLAVGYYTGGQYRYRILQPKSLSYINKLVLNLTYATAFLVPGFSYVFLELFFSFLPKIGLVSPISQTALYAIIFIVFPVYLLGQTVPLISNYFSRKKISHVTGRMLFFSTVGSFLGSIISTLILMVTIGVHYTVVVTVSMLALLIILLNRRFLSLHTFYAIFIIVLITLLNNSYMMKRFNIVSNNNYSLVQVEPVKDQPEAKILKINRSLSSKYTPIPKNEFVYTNFINHRFLEPYNHGQPRNILIIGAGGFSIGLKDKYNHYTYVDIDPNLKDIAQTYLLPEPLTDNKAFVAKPARLFMRQNTTLYDVIILDAYTNVITIPPQLITQEFFAQIKAALKQNGVFVMNTATYANFSDVFSRKLHQTLTTAFPYLNRQVLGNIQVAKEDSLANVIYSSINIPVAEGIYTDDKNTYFLDH